MGLRLRLQVRLHGVPQENYSVYAKGFVAAGDVVEVPGVSHKGATFVSVDYDHSSFATCAPAGGPTSLVSAALMPMAQPKFAAEGQPSVSITLLMRTGVSKSAGMGVHDGHLVLLDERDGDWEYETTRKQWRCQRRGAGFVLQMQGRELSVDKARSQVMLSPSGVAWQFVPSGKGLTSYLFSDFGAIGINAEGRLLFTANRSMWVAWEVYTQVHYTDRPSGSLISMPPDEPDPHVGVFAAAAGWRQARSHGHWSSHR